MHEQQRGKIILVGAGPGDAGLLTIKGAEAIEKADTVVFDNLVGNGVLARIPSTAEAIYVGKISGNHSMQQTDITALLRQKALEGKRVVRLKGGDPFLFGRGGEEVEGLLSEGIEFEVIPGVTSAFSVPAYAGIPVTHRDFCSSVHIVTAHSRNAPADGINFESLASSGGTMIFLMGVEALSSICAGLLQAGMPPETPAAIIEQGTLANQRRVVSTLAKLPAASKAAEIKPPAITVVGKVCQLSDEMAWRERQPLFGVKITLTRPADRGSRLAKLLSSAGAEVISLPAISTEPLNEEPRLDDTVAALNNGDWIAFTSPVGVKLFFEKLNSYHVDVRSLANIHFAAIGQATQTEITKRGITCDFTPEVYSAEELGKGLVKAMQSQPGTTVLLPRSKIGTDNILKPLQEAQIRYHDLPIYDTSRPCGAGGKIYEVLTKDALDWVAFTSESTVAGFAEIVGPERLKGVRALCIGEQTEQAAKGRGMETYTAKQATLESMVACLIETVGRT